MSRLQALSHNRALIRAVLLWFALSLGAAFAAPLMQPTVLGQICSANADASGDQGLPAPHGMQCAACLPFIAPPPALPSASTPVLEPQAPVGATSVCQEGTAPAAVHARGPPAAL